MGAGSFFSGLIGGYSKGHMEAKARAQKQEDDKTERINGYIKSLATEDNMRDPASAAAIMQMMQQTLNPGKKPGQGKDSKGMGILKGMLTGMTSNKADNPAPDVDMSSVAGTIAGAPQRNMAMDEANAKRLDTEKYNTGEQRSKDKAADMGLQPGTEEYYNVRAGRNISVKPPTQQKVHFLIPGSDKIHMGWLAPGTSDLTDASTGERVPSGWTPAAAPSANNGRDLYSQYVKSYAAEYPSLPESSIKAMAAKMLLTEHGIHISQTIQNMGINELNSGGIGGGVYTVKPPKGAGAPVSSGGAGNANIASSQSGPISRIGSGAQEPTAPTPGPVASAPVKPRTAPAPSATPAAPTTASAATPAPPDKNGKYPPLPPLASRRWQQLMGSSKEATAGPALAGQIKGMEQLKSVTGMSDGQIFAKSVERKAVGKALGTAQERSALFDRLNRTIAMHGDLMKQASVGVTRTKVPWLNLKINELRSNFKDDPRLEAFEASVIAVQREYAQIVSGAIMSRAMPSVGSMIEAQKLINPNLTLRSMMSLLNQLTKEAKGEQVAYKDQVGDLKRGLEADPREETLPYGRYMVELPPSMVEQVKQRGDGLHTIYSPDHKSHDVVYRNGRVWEVD